MKFIMIVLTKKKHNKLTDKQNGIKFFYVLYSIFVSCIGVVPIKNHKRDKSVFHNHFLQNKIQKQSVHCTLKGLNVALLHMYTHCIVILIFSRKYLHRNVRGYFMAVIAHVVTKL